MILTRYHRGIELPQADLWLDPWDEKPFAFVSHAHSDHIGNHREIIASRGTARLMQARLPGTRREHLLDFGERREFPGFGVTLLPAGHIFGSAQSFIETGAGTLLYTGDFKLRPSRSAEPAEWRQAEVLIMETTYGLPKYCMPPTEEVVRQMVAFCQEALEEKAVPVLLGYSLGKSQEILCALLNAGLTPMLHGSVHRMTELYRELNPDFPTGYVRYSTGQIEGKVLVCPPNTARSLMLQRIKNRRTAVLTGWALDPGAKFRYGCDAAFPLTDHADYPDLLRYVELVQPKLVLTLHGFAGAFARDLRARGIEAWALSQENQLELTLGHMVVPAAALPAPAQPVEYGPLELSAFAVLGEAISASSGKLRKIELLAGYLGMLDEVSLAHAAVFLTGRAFPQTDNRTLQVGGAVIRRALIAASGKPEAQVRESGRVHRDAGKTTYEVLLHATQPEAFSIAETAAFFEALHLARGPLAKGELLQERLRRLEPMAASYLVRILTGDLRIGLKEGLLEEAVAAAFGVPPDEVREANMLLGDMGKTAVLAARNRLHDAAVEVFRPIKCMLASPEPTAGDIWGRLQASQAQAAPNGRAGGSSLPEKPGPENGRDEPPARPPTPAPPDQSVLPAFWVEDKYDGIRCQLHAAEGRVELFSRDLRRITEQFGDLTRAARGLASRVILDGEIVAWEAGRRLTFFDLQKRLGRKNEDDLFLGRSDVPVIYKAFDLLWLDGISLLREPLRHRRTLLENLALLPGLELVSISAVNSAEEVENAFRTARGQGNEGLMAKDAASLYTPGRRGLAWLKFKKELATLDVVVVGAEYGHGKRSAMLSDYTFAVRDEESEQLLVIGKAYSGVTDAEIEELTEHFTNSTVRRHGKYHEVRPEVVFEVAFDSVQPSQRHPSGLALRFPRIKSIRRDKAPAEIDTLKYARSLVRI